MVAYLFKCKTTFSVHKLIPKNTQMTTLYTISNFIPLSPIYFFILNKNNFVKVSHHYLTLGGNQVCL